MTSNTLGLVVCGLTLGVTAYVAANLPAVGDGAAGAASGEALAARLDELDKRAAATNTAIAELKDSLARIERKLSRAATRASADGDAAGGASSADGVLATGPDGTSGPDGAARAAADGTTPPAVDPAALGAAGDAVAERLERRIEAVARRERARGADGKWHAPIDELSKELGAEEALRGEMVRVFDGGKDRVCDILLTRRGDGLSLVDDYAKALRDSGDAAGSTQTLFKRILEEKVPGTDETYFVAITRVQEGMERDLARHLGDARMEKFRALSVDLLDVKTGHDPVGDAVRERLKQK
jgi:hypothetical protein